MAMFKSCILFLSRLLIFSRIVCSSCSESSLRSFFESIFTVSASSSLLERLLKSALSSGGESLCVEETVPEKPPVFLAVERKISSTSGEDGLLDTRLVSESIVFLASPQRFLQKRKKTFFVSNHPFFVKETIYMSRNGKSFSKTICYLLNIFLIDILLNGLQTFPHLIQLLSM